MLGERSPGNRLRIERLHLLSRPNVGTWRGKEEVSNDGRRGGRKAEKRTLSVEEELALRRDDRLHNDELEDGADDGTEGLSPEGRARRELGVLSHLQVPREARPCAVEL